MTGLYLWRQGRENELDQTLELPRAAGRTLIQRSESDVAMVRFTAANGDEYVFSPGMNDSGVREWVLTDQPEYMLNQRRTREKLRAAWNLSAQDVAHENALDIELSDFGLDPPELAITIAYHTGETRGIFLGGHTIDLERRFIMLEDDPAIYLLSSQSAGQMMLGINNLLDRSLPSMQTQSAVYMLFDRRNRPAVEFTMMELADIVIHMGLPEDEEFIRTRHLAMNRPMQGREFYAEDFDVDVMAHFRAFSLGDAVSISPDNLSVYGLDEPVLSFIFESEHDRVHLLFGDVFEREENGKTTAFIYVKYAERPHIFEAELLPVSYIMDININPFVDRFFCLININDVESINITSHDAARDYEIFINHSHGEDSSAISPTINGRRADESAFRTAYRLLIGLTIDHLIEAEAESHEPPVLTITFCRFRQPAKELRLFTYDANFFKVSVDGEKAWFITNRRHVDAFFQNLSNLER